MHSFFNNCSIASYVIKSPCMLEALTHAINSIVVCFFLLRVLSIATSLNMRQMGFCLVDLLVI